MNETIVNDIFVNDIPIDTGQIPFNTFQLTFGVYDHLVFQILFYMVSITLAIACVYFSVYLVKKLTRLFRNK